jgi:hypothetical protein
VADGRRVISEQWAEKMPSTDYAAIVEGIKG